VNKEEVECTGGEVPLDRFSYSRVDSLKYA
jgi:hypothetical protein